jgi:hypothetical protein
MSLLLHKREIERAISGELDGSQELALRAHVAACDACRSYYDSLSLAARALGKAEATQTEVARERARLEAALTHGIPMPSGATMLSGLRARWPIAIAIPAFAALAIALVIPRLRSGHRAQVTWRGGDEKATAASLSLYAKRKGSGELRLVAELPGSGEAKVSLQDYIQFRIRTMPAQAHLTILGIDSAGEIHRYFASDEGGVSPSVGTSVDLGVGHRPGPLRVYAILSPKPLEWAAVERAGRSASTNLRTADKLDVPAEQVSILLEVEP